MSLWNLSEAFYLATGFGLQWINAPVLYYAGGQLESLVHAFATINLARLGGNSGLEILLRALRPAVLGDSISEKTWDLGLRRKAFLAPQIAAQSFPAYLKRDNKECDLRVAHVLSNELSLPYYRRRELVISHLVKWAASVASRSEVYR
ncbi:MAG TPA: hypothetical protein VFO29_11950 [Candidatus Rubrimentiphilum sp.]|nr:hypothetical protein [Candidatus Rubrimentiphilum sp.]